MDRLWITRLGGLAAGIIAVTGLSAWMIPSTEMVRHPSALSQFAAQSQAMWATYAPVADALVPPQVAMSQPDPVAIEPGGALQKAERSAGATSTTVDDGAPGVQPDHNAGSNDGPVVDEDVSTRDTSQAVAIAPPPAPPPGGAVRDYADARKRWQQTMSRYADATQSQDSGQ